MLKKMMMIGVVMLALSVAAKDYHVVDYGAVSDTTRLSTTAIQQAIDACAENGGGRVVVDAGQYKTGTLVMRSHVDLYIERGATLYGSTDLKDYRPMTTDYVSLRTQTPTVQLVYADGAENVSISGGGTIDGRGAAFRKLSWNDEGITRPHLLRFIQCSDVSISGVTLKNSGCWMQHYLACDRVQIRGIRIFNRNNYNNDALDIDGCHDVTVSDIMADSDDDGITLKSTSPRLCENVCITNCIISSHCNAIKLGTETNGGFRNISISNCIVKPSDDQSTQFFGDPSKRGTSTLSLEITDGGVMENVHVSNIVAEGTESPIFVRLGHRARGYAEGIPVTKVGRIKGVHLSNMTVNHAGRTGCSITGLPGHPVEDVWLSDITIHQQGGVSMADLPKTHEAVKDEKEKDYPEATMWGVLPAKGFFVRHARHVVFQNVSVTTAEEDARPEYVEVDVE